MREQTQQVDSLLFPFTEDELKMREFYLEHGRLATFEEADRLTGQTVPFHPLSIFHNRELQQKQYFSGYFREEHFFPPGADVFFTKHQCYSSVREHKHDFYEICYVRNGLCKQILVYGQDKKEIILQEGDFFFLSPGQVHTVVVDTDSVVVNTGIKKTTFFQTFYRQIPDDTVLDQFFRAKIQQNEKKGYLLFRTGAEQPIWDYYCAFIDTYFHPGRYAGKLLNLELAAMFIRLLEQFSGSVTGDTSGSSESRLVPEVIEWFENHFYETNVAKTARQFGYSPDHLNREFKRATGKTMQQTLTEVRMEIAKKALQYEDLSVAEVSDYVGYEDTTNFIRNFKKVVGCTPGQFRAKRQT